MPITATRSPASACSWSHCAEWKVVPWKVSRPSSCGRAGSLRPPMPLIRISAVKSPAEVWISQRRRSSFQAASSISWSKRMCGGIAVFVGDAFQIGLDLRLRRAQARPVGVERERERVQVRGHVAGAPRVAVVAPGPAEPRGALEQHEVVLPALLEPDRRAEAGKAGADDHDAVVVRRAHQPECPVRDSNPPHRIKSPALYQMS